MFVVYEFLYTRIPFHWNMTQGTDVAKEDTVFIFKGLSFDEETSSLLKKKASRYFGWSVTDYPATRRCFPQQRRSLQPRRLEAKESDKLLLIAGCRI